MLSTTTAAAAEEPGFALLHKTGGTFDVPRKVYVFIIELEKIRIGKSNYGVQNFNIKATTWRIYSLLNIKTLLLTLI